MRIAIVDHTERGIAARIHAVQMRAYAQEAALLGAKHFPPLQRTVQDIVASDETFLAALGQDDLVAALGFSESASATSIDSLVVSPDFQRQGIGRALLETLLASHAHRELVLQTGARNAPALALYASCGFIETERWFAGAERLELVRLRRLPGERVARC